jgi:hypothetical protein
MLQIVASLKDDSTDIMYDSDMFIVQITGLTQNILFKYSLIDDQEYKNLLHHVLVHYSAAH